MFQSPLVILRERFNNRGEGTKPIQRSFGFSRLNQILTQSVCFSLLFIVDKSVTLQRYGFPYFHIVIQTREHFRIKRMTD